MKIAYNPLAEASLTEAPSNNDITFDLSGIAIYAKGVKFEGTDTTYSVFKKHTSDNEGGYNGLVPVPSYTTTTTRYLREDGTWVVPTNYYRPISVNGTSILENNNTALNLVAGANISITAENSSGYTGKVIITNTGVRSTTINGNCLRVDTNGTNADLTIPYATSAGNADSANLASILKSTRYDTNDPSPNTSVGVTFQFSYLASIGWHNVLTMKSYEDNNYTAAQLITPASNPEKDSEYSGDMKWRQGRNSTWLDWKTILDSSNYSSFIGSYYIPSQSMMNSAYATIPTYNGETGWHRIATIKGSVGYGSYILYLCGNWSWASNTNAIIHIDTMHTTAQLTQVSGIVGYVTHIRLVNVSNDEYYVDVYINYSGPNTPGTVHCYFLGNGTITPRTTVEKITSAVTASAELTLADGGFSHASLALKDSNDGKNITACYSTGGFSSNPSWLAAWNGYHLTYVAPSVLSVNYATSAGSIGGFTISNFMTYAYNPSYVAASFTDENLSKKAGEKFIEYWDSAGGWFNSAWGQVTANYGFVGNLTGTASYATSAGSATKATQDSDGNTINATYLKLSGGTMTGAITTPGNDTVVIKPKYNNYDQIGGEGQAFWKIWATNFYGTLNGSADQVDGYHISVVTSLPATKVNNTIYILV